MRRIEWTKPGGPEWLAAGMFLGWPFMETIWIRGMMFGPAWTVVGAVAIALAGYGCVLRPVHEASLVDGPFLGSLILDRVRRIVLATALIALIAWTAMYFRGAAEQWIRVARDAAPLRAAVADWSWLVSLAWFNAIWYGASRGRDALERSTRLWGVAALAVAGGLAWRLVDAMERGRAVRELTWRDAPWDVLAGAWPYIAIAGLAAPLLLAGESTSKRTRALWFGAVGAGVSLALSLFAQQAIELSSHWKLDWPLRMGVGARVRADPVFVWQILILALTGLVAARLACFTLLRLAPPSRIGRWSTAGLVVCACLPVLDLPYWDSGAASFHISYVVLFAVWCALPLTGAAAATVWLRRAGRRPKRVTIPFFSGVAVAAVHPWWTRTFPSGADLWMDLAPWATALGLTLILSRRERSVDSA